MIVAFEFSQDTEVSRVLYTLKKMQWYTANKYAITLPSGVDSSSDGQAVLEAVHRDYDVAVFENFRSQLEAHKDSYTQLHHRLMKHFPNTTPAQYVIRLTRYGVGGSYHLPNRITLKVGKHTAFKSVLHEMVHLSVEPFVEKYRISHWSKERIVDCYLNRFVPEYRRWQKSYHGAEKIVDQFFDLIEQIPEKVFERVADYELQLQVSDD